MNFVGSWHATAQTVYAQAPCCKYSDSFPHLHFIFVVGTVVRDRLFSELFYFALLVTFPPLLHTHILPSPAVFNTHDQAAQYPILHLELLGIKGQLYILIA
jgi:hypothetical protein